ncbi:AAA family ATPase [Cereibacter sphaeroides]|uniref:AAA family ATPase n=1 Tax=Cereibacter sphaeroides TaxID=1063 RepID=UPI0009B691A4|nr:AAA family ATPase [Cereibacter sphaeroides]
MHPTRFQIFNLFNARNVDIEFSGNCGILVGPNGIGKSSVANIFYFLISRQWERMVEYKFDRVALWFGDDVVEIERGEITGLSRMADVFRSLSPSSRMYSILDRLKSEGRLEELIKDMTVSDVRYANMKKYISDDLPPDQLRHFMYTFQRKMAHDVDDLISLPKKNIEAHLDKYLPGRTLYLPTYRRIEKDLREISPKLRRKFDEISDGELELTRSSRYYVDLVSFGMNDVRKRLDGLANELRDFSLSKFNELSGLYLKDVIRDRAGASNADQIRDLSDSALSNILDRVSEDVLSKSDKDLLRDRIRLIRSQQSESIDMRDQFLAHYFSRLVVINEEISQKEGDIIAFINTCNKYLHPLKIIEYDEATFSTAVVDRASGALDLSLLSSGEKQVISVFAHLFLDKQDVQTVVIDEPELSLSVPWQKRFLEDILNSGKCSFLLSVTHSPFVYQNSLRPHAVDLRRHMR